MRFRAFHSDRFADAIKGPVWYVYVRAFVAFISLLYRATDFYDTSPKRILRGKHTDAHCRGNIFPTDLLRLT